MMAGQFYWWREPEYPEKTIDLSQVTGKRYYITLRFRCCKCLISIYYLESAILVRFMMLNHLFYVSVL